MALLTGRTRTGRDGWETMADVLRPGGLAGEHDFFFCFSHVPVLQTMPMQSACVYFISRSNIPSAHTILAMPNHSIPATPLLVIESYLQETTFSLDHVWLTPG